MQPQPLTMEDYLKFIDDFKDKLSTMHVYLDKISVYALKDANAESMKNLTICLLGILPELQALTASRGGVESLEVDHPNGGKTIISFNKYFSEWGEKLLNRYSPRPDDVDFNDLFNVTEDAIIALVKPENNGFKNLSNWTIDTMEEIVALIQTLELYKRTAQVAAQPKEAVPEQPAEWTQNDVSRDLQQKTTKENKRLQRGGNFKPGGESEWKKKKAREETEKRDANNRKRLVREMNKADEKDSRSGGLKKEPSRSGGLKKEPSRRGELKQTDDVRRVYEKMTRDAAPQKSAEERILPREYDEFVKWQSERRQPVMAAFEDYLAKIHAKENLDFVRTAKAFLNNPTPSTARKVIAAIWDTDGDMILNVSGNLGPSLREPLRRYAAQGNGAAPDDLLEQVRKLRAAVINGNLTSSYDLFYTEVITGRMQIPRRR
jgi:hypothetical protein